MSKGDHNVQNYFIAGDLYKTKMAATAFFIGEDNKENEDDIWITEIWETKEDHSNSLQNESVKELIALAMPYLDGQPSKGREMDLIGGLGV